jgi:hypothetical protein
MQRHERRPLIEIGTATEKLELACHFAQRLRTLNSSSLFGPFQAGERIVENFLPSDLETASDAVGTSTFDIEMAIASNRNLISLNQLCSHWVPMVAPTN